jgi:hypothetical protein
MLYLIVEIVTRFTGREKSPVETGDVFDCLPYKKKEIISDFLTVPFTFPVHG